ncbi:MAG: hypothetical protein KatS3mg105_0867 [Gemmatales bacterium]|nr:MAG: hypothetical protein KatS3mg105_0867 [Gemmatales bacterium]
MVKQQICLRVVLVWLAFLSRPALGQDLHREGFETKQLSWFQMSADARFEEKTHEITRSVAHSGDYSEHIRLIAQQGTKILYAYPTPRAPISDELNVSLWVKANRPGIQLLAEVVLPREPLPTNLDARMTTLIAGSKYLLTGRWQRLQIRLPVKAANEQQRLMRAQMKRDVDFTDAYITRLVLNVYAGPGLTELWIDDIEISPVFQDPPSSSAASERAAPGQKTSRADGVPETPKITIPPRNALVELNQENLLVSGQRFFFRGIRHSDTPLKALRDARFNTVWVDYRSPVDLLNEAVNLGFWLVPSLAVTARDTGMRSIGDLSQEVTRFPASDAVLFWDLGGGVVHEQKDTIFRAARAVRFADPQRPLGADVWDGLRPYSRALDMIGAHRFPLMTTLELEDYRTWLNQRRLLARPGTFMWTWVQTHLPDWYLATVYNRTDSTSRFSGFSEPIGPQPEQIRLLTYLALAAGARGLGFWSDRFLADSHQGRDRLLTLALLNIEMEMLEPLLVTSDVARWIPTTEPNVKAAVMRGKYGVLVLPMWLGSGAQFVPGQSAVANLQIVVPEVPIGSQAWLVTPAYVRSLRSERVAGGTRVTIPEFGLTGAVVFTTDIDGMLVRLQMRSRQMRKVASQWAHDLAEVEIDKVSRIDVELARMGHTLPDGAVLMADARRRLELCKRYWSNGNYREAYAEAERATRPLRIAMRAHWEEAIRGLSSPVSSPYAVSFFTLPQHWRFMQELRSCAVGPNVLPNGDFELAPDRVPRAWTPQETTLDDVEMRADRVAESAKKGRQCLRLRITPKNQQKADGKPVPPPAALERTFLAINSPAVRLAPGTLVRITGWLRIPKPIAASVDGALFYDSAGGEPLGVRVHRAIPWRRITLYRRVPASGQINVTLALTGIGEAYFDDIRIEPLTPTTTASRQPQAVPVSRIQNR